MARPRQFGSTLSDEERNRLRSIAAASTSQIRHVQRAGVILEADKGLSNKQIAEKLQISTPTVCKILKKWSAYGVQGALDDLKRTGRPAIIDLPAKSWVISLACTLPKDLKDGPGMMLWTVAALTNYIREHYAENGHQSLQNISASTVWEILNDNAIKPHRIKYYLEKKDDQFEEKARRILLLYKRVSWILKLTPEGISPMDAGGEVIMSYDEKPGIQAIGNIAPDRAPTPGHGTVSRDYEYKRYGTVSLLAGIDLFTGQVTSLVRDTHKSADFIDFLKLVDEKYDSNLLIRIILDNHTVHRSKKVMEYLATKEGRFEFAFTPKHASWLNLVECFFSKLARRSLRNLRVKSKAELVEHIEKWIEQTNEDPVTFTWEWNLDDIWNAFS